MPGSYQRMTVLTGGEPLSESDRRYLAGEQAWQAQLANERAASSASDLAALSGFEGPDAFWAARERRAVAVRQREVSRLAAAAQDANQAALRDAEEAAWDEFSTSIGLGGDRSVDDRLSAPSSAGGAGSPPSVPSATTFASPSEAELSEAAWAAFDRSLNL